jgi:hypothetical protein
MAVRLRPLEQPMSWAAQTPTVHNVVGPIPAAPTIATTLGRSGALDETRQLGQLRPAADDLEWRDHRQSLPWSRRDEHFVKRCGREVWSVGLRRAHPGGAVPLVNGSMPTSVAITPPAGGCQGARVQFFSFFVGPPGGPTRGYSRVPSPRPKSAAEYEVCLPHF